MTNISHKNVFRTTGIGSAGVAILPGLLSFSPNGVVNVALLGALAQRSKKKIEYNSKQMKITNHKVLNYI